MPMADVIEDIKKKQKTMADVIEQQGGSPLSVPSSIPVWQSSPVGWETVSRSPGARVLGSIFGTIFDVIQRGEYAAAGAAQALMEGAYKSIPGRILQGVLGRDKTTYQDVMHKTLPEFYKEQQGPQWEMANRVMARDYSRIDYEKWPAWIKSAIGFAGSVAYDPMNYIPFGALAKGAVKVTHLDEAYDAIKGTKAGQYIAKHFSTRAALPEGMAELYQQMRNEANYLVSKAVENNVPLEQAMRDIEKNLGIPRDVIAELIERPVVVETQELVQKALPLTAEVPLEAGKTMAYVVKEGDTLSDIAKEAGVSARDLARLNGIKDPNAIRVGQTIQVPAQSRVGVEIPQPPKVKTVPQKPLPLTTEVPVGKAERLPEGVQQALGLTREVPVKAAKEVVSHTVQAGETLSEIAKRYGTSVDAIAKANDIKDVNKILAGQELKIPVAPKVSVAVEQPPKKLEGIAKDVGLPLTTQAEIGQDTPIGTTTKVISQLDALSDEARAMVEPVVSQFKKWADDTIAVEKAAGIAIEPLQSDVLEYLSHYMTAEAKNALKKSGADWRHLLGVKVQHGSTIPREIKDLSIQEINKLGEAGKIIPGYYGKVFMDDPVLVKTIRDVMSAKAVASAHFLDEAIKNPQWALKEGAPQGWRELSDAARARFGPKVEGYKFAPEIADALEKVIKRTFEPESIDALWKGYDSFLSFWRRITLGTSPQWMVNNAVGNLWNSFLADINPKNYLTAGNVMLGKQGTIKGMSYADVLELAKKEGVWNASLYGSELAQQLGEAALGRGKQSLTNLVTSPIFKGNTLIENHARLSLFIDGLEKGMSPSQAASRVRKYLFDYTDLTDTEKNVFRRIVPFYCVTEDAECLTREGWRRYDQIEVGTEILTYNLTDGRLEWQPVQDVFVADYSGHMLHFSGKTLDVVTTVDHRFVTERGLKEARFVGYNDRIPLTGDYDAPEYPISDRVLSLIGWLATDGHTRIRKGRYPEYCIYQKKQPYLNEIRELVGESGKEYVHPQTGVSQIYIKRPLHTEIAKHYRCKDDLIRLVLRLSARQLFILRETMFKAEGNTRHVNGRYSFACFAQEDPIVKAAYQLILFLTGSNSRYGQKGIYLRDRERRYAKGFRPTVVWYTGKIWCPNTPNATWIMRRNGRILPTGNTWYRKNLPLQLEALATKPGKFATLPKAQRAIESTQPAVQEKETLPDWLQEQFPVQVGVTPEGYTKFATMGNIPAMDLLMMNKPQDVLSMNPIASAVGTMLGLNIWQDRYIEPTAMQNVLGVAPMPERLSGALQTLFPPLRTAQNIVHPYESKYGTTPTLPERLLGLTGLKVYERYQPADVANYFRDIERQIGDLEYQYRDALRQGDSKLAEALMKKILVLQEQARRMAQ